MQLNIQMFGGRGARSGVKRNGMILGMQSGLKATVVQPLPVYDNYPDFPDPDYSKYKINTKDKFINEVYKMVNYKRNEHYEIAKKYVKSLGINDKVEITKENNGAYGAVMYNVDNNNIIHVVRYNLNEADTRRMEYKVKTMIHEGIHAKLDGRKNNTAYGEKQTRLYEETRTEMVAMYLAHKINGFDYVPSYAKDVSIMAKRYKQLPEYSDCKTIYDLGEKIYKERFNNKEPNYKELAQRLINNEITFKKQNDYIVKHKDECYNVIKDSLFNWQFYNKEYITNFNDLFYGVYDKLVNKKNNFISKENIIYQKLVAYVMTKEGI